MRRVSSISLFALALIALHLAITLPLLNGPLSPVSDEALYHYVTIQNIRAHWPSIDFNRDVHTTVSPGYHYFLATISQATGASIVTLRLINDLVSLLIPLTLFFWLTRWVSPLRAFWLVLPVLFSGYFIRDACRVMTDNASILTVLFTLACLFLLPSRGWAVLPAGLLGTIATAVRQLAIWLEIPLILQPIFDYLYPKPGSSRLLPSILDVLAWSLRLLPLSILAFLYSQWHGFTPAEWRSKLDGFSVAPACFVLSLFACLGLPLLLSLGFPMLRRFVFSRWTFLAALIGFALAFISSTEWNISQGRWGGAFWLVIGKFPVVHDRSVFFFFFTPLGGAILCVFVQLIAENTTLSRALLWLSCVLGWISTYLFCAQIFQRYFEVQLLVFLIIGFALILAPNPDLRLRRWPLIPLCAYLLFSLVSTILYLLSGEAHSMGA